MNNRPLLIVTSLLTMLLFITHWVQDIQWGLDKVGPANIGLLAIMLVWLLGTLVWPDKVAGLVIVLLASFLAAGVFVLHIRSASAVRIAGSEGGLPFVWTLAWLGIGGVFGFALSVRGLWLLRKRA